MSFDISQIKYDPRVILPSDTDVDEHVSMVRGFCETMVGTGSLVPHLIADVRAFEREMRQEKLVVAMMLPFDTRREKESAMFQMGQMVFERRVVPMTVSLITEAWMSTQVGNKRQFLIPEDDPNRKEVAFCQTIVMHRGPDRCVFLDRPIKRVGDVLSFDGDWSEKLEGSARLFIPFFKGFTSNCKGFQEYAAAKSP